MASDKGEMAMDKMKLHLKSEAIFSPDEYFRKARTYLANCMDIFLWALIYILKARGDLFTERVRGGNLPIAVFLCGIIVDAVKFVR